MEVSLSKIHPLLLIQLAIKKSACMKSADFDLSASLGRKPKPDASPDQVLIPMLLRVISTAGGRKGTAADDQFVPSRCPHGTAAPCSPCVS
jgi:hypothetical protein